MARLVVKDRHLKVTCYDEIRPSAQTIDTVPSLKENTIGRIYVIFFREQEFSL